MSLFYSEFLDWYHHILVFFFLAFGGMQNYVTSVNLIGTDPSFRKWFTPKMSFTTLQSPEFSQGSQGTQTIIVLTMIYHYTSLNSLHPLFKNIQT
jgi:hypothetical protein